MIFFTATKKGKLGYYTETDTVILSQNSTAGGITIPNFKFYYRAVVTNTG